MSEVVIRVRDDGPLVIQGPVKIIDAQGREFVAPAGKPNIALCRCGHSGQKPFCDGSHRHCGFVAQDRAEGKE